MMAEYAGYYGGPPAPELSWSLFLALLQRTGRHDARRKLIQFESIVEGVGGALSSDGSTDRIHDRLKRAAFPMKRQGPKFLPNKWLKTNGDEADEGAPDG